MFGRSQRAFGPPSAPGAVPGSSPAQEHGTAFNSTFDRTSRFGYDFSPIPIHAPAAGAIQTKLGINQPGDEYEQEADRIAEHVMRMSEPQLQRACTCGGACPKCQTEPSAQEHEHLQTKRVQASDAGQSAAPPIVHEVLRSPGQPLDPATRAFMEPRFGHDFSKIRVHADNQAAESVKAVQALAYTVGQDVVFGAGQYVPHNEVGRRLLAHELAHTLQQRTAASGLLQGPITLEGENGKVPETPTPAVQILQRKPPPSAPPKDCHYSIKYSKPRMLDCDTVYKNATGKNPPEPLCGRGLLYDILSVSTSGKGCPAKLEGLELTEKVTGNGGCVPRNYVWSDPKKTCKIGSDGKLSECTDTYSLCGPTRNLQGTGCTEVVTQELLVGGQHAETHHITFDLDKSPGLCTGEVKRD